MESQDGVRGEADRTQPGRVSMGKVSLVLTDPEVEHRALMSLRVDICNQGEQRVKNLVICAQVDDPACNPSTPLGSRPVARLDCVDAREDRAAFLCLEIEHPQLWTPQTPALYQLRLVVEDHQGQVMATRVQAFGIQQYASGHYGVKQGGEYIAMVPSDTDAHAFWIANQFSYISLDRFEPHWELQEDGVTIAEGTLDRMPLAPGQAVKLSLPVQGMAYKRQAHYEWILSFRPLAKSLWGPVEQSVSSGKLCIQ